MRLTYGRMIRSSLLLLVLLVLAAGGTAAEETGSDESQKDMEAYAAAKETVSKLAAEIAGNRLERAVHAYIATGVYEEVREYKELRSVAEDAWPFLRDEWKRVITLPESPETGKRLRIIMACWTQIKEVRALGLLVQYIQERKKKEHIGAVEYISGVYHGMMSEMSAEDLQAYEESFLKWWKEYQPRWEGEMALREKRETLFRNVDSGDTS